MSDKDNIVTIESKDELQDTTDENELVLIDFFADWCGPCKMMEDTIEEIADETDIVIAEIDIDQHQHIAAEFGVQSIPTYIFYRDGEAKEQLIGFQEKEDMMSVIDK